MRKFYMLWQGGGRESDWEEEWLTVVLESMWKRGAREGDFRSHEAAATRRYGRAWKPERHRPDESLGDEGGPAGETRRRDEEESEGFPLGRGEGGERADDMGRH